MLIEYLWKWRNLCISRLKHKIITIYFTILSLTLRNKKDSPACEIIVNQLIYLFLQNNLFYLKKIWYILKKIL